MLYQVALTFGYGGEILLSDRSNRSYRAVLSDGSVCFSVVYKIHLALSMNFGFDCCRQCKGYKLYCFQTLPSYEAGYLQSPLIISHRKHMVDSDR